MIKKKFDPDRWMKGFCPFCFSQSIKVDLDPLDSDHTWIANSECFLCKEKWKNIYRDNGHQEVIHRYGEEIIS